MLVVIKLRTLEAAGSRQRTFRVLQGFVTLRGKVPRCRVVVVIIVVMMRQMLKIGHWLWFQEHGGHAC